MGKINSRAKGARGEREFRDVLKSHGYTARRGQQFSGDSDAPDVICDELKPFFHFEVKLVKRFMIYPSIEQAENDRAPGQIPVVAHRGETVKGKKKPWLAILPMEDFLEFVTEWKERGEK